MKSKRAMVFAGVLLCTFLSLNATIQQIGQFSAPFDKSEGIGELTGIWSKVIVAEEKETKIPDAVMVASTGKSSLQVSYKLFGVIPLKSNTVEQMPEFSLLPGGQSIGVSLQTKGVMVVGQAPIQNQEGKNVYPAKEVGINVGDVILKINDQEVNTDQDVANAIHLAGENQGFAKIVFVHKGQQMEKEIKPVFCSETKRYRIGLFVRNEAAGVGTLTFYDPVSKKYGALGHVINDVDTNQMIEVRNGNVVASTIFAIEKGKRGHPGEKIGSFVSKSKFSGNIEKNTISGIFGTIEGEIVNPFYKEPIPVGWESEIQEGPAKIYTVLEGETIEEYNVEIERIMANRTDSKNMVIKIVDPQLIEKTGGIIQGMSGSPIIQNGKIVGAVTHVFVNDATRGYGVFIQNMLRDGGILPEKKAA
ncbi:MAG: SpoIVB peptidase [Desulfitobacterium sp.]|nr:SpoIVB peptidase [Desulfitobacterium sp.]